MLAHAHGQGAQPAQGEPAVERRSGDAERVRPPGDLFVQRGFARDHGPANHVAVMSNVSAAYAPDGQHLVAVSGVDAAADDADGFANGMRVDSKSGRIFVAHGDRRKVDMLSSEGKLLRSFEVGASVNGIAFKDGEFDRIFATGGSRSGKKDAGQLFEIRIAE